MKGLRRRQTARVLTAFLLAVVMAAGCVNQGEAREQDKNIQDKNIQSENIVLTETGEVLDRETDGEVPQAEEKPADTAPEATGKPTDSPGPVATPPIELVEPEQELVITDVDQKAPSSDALQLVFLGDSIFDTYRDGTGIPYRTATQCGADVYNLAIGGTCAALESDEDAEIENWTSTSLIGVVNALMKVVPTDVFEGKTAKKILDNPEVDFSKTDYFIVEYGMNDFLRGTPLDTEEREAYNLRTYTGALRYAVVNLKEFAPDATIILCSPTYAQFYNGNWMIGDGNSINNGYGTLFDYKGICNYVANEQQVLFFNAYQDLGIDGYTAEEYLEDGIHLTDSGRQLYADALAKIILKHEETKNN